MSRRTNPNQDRAEANRATLKSLVKLESNKSCADCKRNKHPRWASWNLGIFVCIRCSGIHRGMGTHISRVKSVDLDSWTDEQLQSMIRWGNTRANKYWESKLAPGHVPSESKIENFIRTKYESKRWAMEGGIPDPSTLGSDGDDDVPLNVVQEKAKLERASSVNASSSATPTFRAPARPQPQMDLMGSDDGPQRPSTTDPISRQPPAKAPVAPPKQTRPGDSLLGLDFLGGTQSAPPQQPLGAAPQNTAAAPRTDLKQSILSLYASAPRAAASPPQQAQHQHSSSDSFGGFQSTGQQNASGFNDAFSSLSFGDSSAKQSNKADPFGNLGSSSRQQPSTSSFGGGGGFFDPPTAKSAAAAAPNPPSQAQRTLSSASGFGDFFSSTSPTTTAPPPTPPKNNINSAGGDLFDLSVPTPAPISAPTPAQSNVTSAFNLSQSSVPVAAPKQKPTVSSGNFGGSDPWASGDVWSSPNVPAQAAPTSAAPVASNGGLSNDFGHWSSAPKSPPKVTQDDDFGGWNNAPGPSVTTPAAPAAPTAPGKSSSSGYTGNSDPFENPWG